MCTNVTEKDLGTRVSAREPTAAKPSRPNPPRTAQTFAMSDNQ